MQQGQPLVLQDLLPLGMRVDDLLIVSAALAVFLIIWSLGQLFIPRDYVGPRLKALQERRAELKGEFTRTRHRAKLDHTTTMSFIRSIVRQLKLLQQHQTDQLQTTLIQAGFRSKDAIIVFAFGKLTMPFVGLAMGALVSGIDWANAFSSAQALGWFLLITIGFLGARMPDIIVSRARKKRHHAIRRALPDALDLMLICAEAGLSLTAALDRVSREMARVSPILAEELGLTSVELGFLPDRATALKHLSERVDIKEIRGMVNVIAQTEKYGTPIAQALRVLSKEYRTERMLRVEQKAARLPALMTVPMIVFILPALFIVVIAPAAISVMDTMK